MVVSRIQPNGPRGMAGHQPSTPPSGLTALGRHLGLVFSHTTRTIGLYPLCPTGDAYFLSLILHFLHFSFAAYRFFFQHFLLICRFIKITRKCLIAASDNLTVLLSVQQPAFQSPRGRGTATHVPFAVETAATRDRLTVTVCVKCRVGWGLWGSTFISCLTSRFFLAWIMLSYP